jgi:hypothetical protein
MPGNYGPSAFVVGAIFSPVRGCSLYGYKARTPLFEIFQKLFVIYNGEHISTVL